MTYSHRFYEISLPSRVQNRQTAVDYENRQCLWVCFHQHSFHFDNAHIFSKTWLKHLSVDISFSVFDTSP